MMSGVGRYGQKYHPIIRRYHVIANTNNDDTTNNNNYNYNNNNNNNTIPKGSHRQRSHQGGRVCVRSGRVLHHQWVWKGKWCIGKTVPQFFFRYPFLSFPPSSPLLSSPPLSFPLYLVILHLSDPPISSLAPFYLTYPSTVLYCPILYCFILSYLIP